MIGVKCFHPALIAGMFNFVAAALLEITEPAKREAPKVPS